MQKPVLQFDPETAWKRYEPSDKQPWNAMRVARLHRRSGLGLSWHQLERELSDGFEISVERVLEGQDYAPDGRSGEEHDRFVTAMIDSCRRDPSIGRLTHLWLYRLTLSPHPLAEKMSLVWHSHYAVSQEKVRDAGRMLDYYLTLREHWDAKALEFHRAILRDPAIMEWLDAVGSRKGDPNENLAREFFELFALGEGNYTERDVQEAARALTGWESRDDELKFVPEYHDDGEKTILGETGPWDAEDLVRIACRQLAAARHLARRLWETFISDTHDPSEELLDALAERMRTPDDVDIRKGIETVLRSNLFYSDICADKKIASPADLVIGALKACKWLPPDLELSQINIFLTRMGQRLLYPPGVAGWPGGLSWLRESALVERTNFAAWMGSEAAGPDGEHLREICGDVPGWPDRLSTLLTGEKVAEGVRDELGTSQGNNGECVNRYRNVLQAILSSPKAQTL